jgi:hypothetical protein
MRVVAPGTDIKVGLTIKLAGQAAHVSLIEDLHVYLYVAFNGNKKLLAVAAKNANGAEIPIAIEDDEAGKISFIIHRGITANNPGVRVYGEVRIKQGAAGFIQNKKVSGTSGEIVIIDIGRSANPNGLL